MVMHCGNHMTWRDVNRDLVPDVNGEKEVVQSFSVLFINDRPIKAVLNKVTVYAGKQTVREITFKDGKVITDTAPGIPERWRIVPPVEQFDPIGRLLADSEALALCAQKLADGESELRRQLRSQSAGAYLTQLYARSLELG